MQRLHTMEHIVASILNGTQHHTFDERNSLDSNETCSGVEYLVCRVLSSE